MIHEYHCKKCSTITEDFVVYVDDMKAEVACEGCGCPAQKIISRSMFRLGWVRPVIDTAQECWAGTALEGSDGINPLYYESDKIQVDGGHKVSHGGDKRATRSKFASSTFE